MFGFFKKENKKSKSGGFQFVDCHSHILPGIDDGAATIEDSLILVRELVSAGAKEIFATPHYVEETIYNSPRSANLKLLAKLQARLDAEGINVRVHLGNEIYITKDINSLLRAGTISSYDRSPYVLVELPMSGDYPGYEDIFLSLLRQGYFVVLAHPERYDSFSDDFSLVSNLHEMGVLFQSNIGSFAGQYGKKVLRLAEKLAREKMIFAVGSDIHHPHPGLFDTGLSNLSKFYSDEELSRILIGNPGKILSFSNK